jgi:hypothetical protein
VSELAKAPAVIQSAFAIKIVFIAFVAVENKVVRYHNAFSSGCGGNIRVLSILAATVHFGTLSLGTFNSTLCYWR